MNPQVLRGKLAVEAFHSFQRFLLFRGPCKHIAAVYIHGQLSLFIHLAQDLIDSLMEFFILWETRIKERNHTSIFAIIHQSHKRTFDLLIRQAIHIKQERPGRAFKGISGHMSILAHKVA